MNFVILFQFTSHDRMRSIRFLNIPVDLIINFISILYSELIITCIKPSSACSPHSKQVTRIICFEIAIICLALFCNISPRSSLYQLFISSNLVQRKWNKVNNLKWFATVSSFFNGTKYGRYSLVDSVLAY